MQEMITEGKARIAIPIAKKIKKLEGSPRTKVQGIASSSFRFENPLRNFQISKQMPVFYNPAMKHNRDISVLVLNTIGKKDMQIADPLAASGIRSIRFLLELDRGIIKNISINDNSKGFLKTIKNNLKSNKIKINEKIIIDDDDANLFLLNSTGFDYIDIDPFGTPNPFLDSAVKRIAREGILAVTATDLSSLAGTYPEVCRRRYWAAPLRDEMMHETGLRILIRKVQLIGSQYEKGLMPIFSYFKDHYFRIFFRCEKGKKKADQIIEKHGSLGDSGPMWLGSLWDKDVAAGVYSCFLKDDLLNKDKELGSFLKIIKEESSIGTIGFYDIHKIVKRNAIKSIPKKELLIKRLNKLGYKAANTHFDVQGVRSDISLDELTKIIKCQKFSTSL